MTTEPSPPSERDHAICDYEGSPYRRVFWEDADRSYEDAAERLAVRSLLPHAGRRLLDIGAGFGRLVDEYAGYEQVLLLDYAASMLSDARERLGDRCTYICADLYRLPLASGTLDAVVEVRVLHHVAGVEDAFREVARVLRPGGAFVLEFANKRHVKAVARYFLGQGAASPFIEAPYEFVPLNWDFHPAYVERALTAVGLEVDRRRPVSLFRQRQLKRLLPARLLARLDGLVGPPLGRLAPAPSQFLLCTKPGRSEQVAGLLWRCPACGHEPLPDAAATIQCPECGRNWPLVEGIRHFRPGEDATG